MSRSLGFSVIAGLLSIAGMFGGAPIIPLHPTSEIRRKRTKRSRWTSKAGEPPSNHLLQRTVGGANGKRDRVAVNGMMRSKSAKSAYRHWVQRMKASKAEVRWCQAEYLELNREYFMMMDDLHRVPNNYTSAWARDRHTLLENTKAAKARLDKMLGIDKSESLWFRRSRWPEWTSHVLKGHSANTYKARKKKAASDGFGDIPYLAKAGVRKYAKRQAAKQSRQWEHQTTADWDNSCAGYQAQMHVNIRRRLATTKQVDAISPCFAYL